MHVDMVCCEYVVSVDRKEVLILISILPILRHLYLSVINRNGHFTFRSVTNNPYHKVGSVGSAKKLEKFQNPDANAHTVIIRYLRSTNECFYLTSFTDQYGYM